MTARNSVPMLVTATNAACGIAAVFCAARGHPFAALWLLVIAAFLDGIDGWIARQLKVECEAGANADTVADVISFGVAPAALVFSIGASLWLFAAALFYFIMILVRLLRYRLRPEPKGIFLGLPSPVAALFLAAVAQFVISFNVSAPWVIGAAVVIGMLAILPVRFPAWHHAAIRVIPAAVRLTYLLAIIAFLFFRTSETLIVVITVYIFLSPVLLVRYQAREMETERSGGVST